MIKTTYQKPEIRDANDNIIQQGAFGKNTALANSTNDGWIDYVANDLEFLYDLAKDEIVPVPSLPASGQMNKTYLLTTTGVSYRWSGTEWVAVSSSEAVGRAESAASLAEQWATKTDGTVDGTEYSAKYYAEQAEQSADDAQDVADDMATHLSQIDQNTGGVSANSKRIGNIEKLLQGNLYDYDTDDDVAYTKTVPSGALPYAGIETLGGKTLVWNQLVQNGNFEDTTGWEHPYADIVANNNILSATVTSVTTAGATRIELPERYCPMITGHKYYATCMIYSPALISCMFQNRNVASGTDPISVPANTWTRFDVLYTCTNNSGSMLYYNLNSGLAVGDTVQFKEYMVFDLTLMFGSGNEPTSVAEFQQMFPSAYYPYNAGTLLSAGVTEVVSEGVNVMPVTEIKTITVNGVTETIYPDGTLTLTGTSTISGGRLTFIESFSLPAGNYRLQCSFPQTFLHKDTTILAQTTSSSAANFTLTETTTVSIGFNTVKDTTYNFTGKIQVVRGSTDKAYSPYVEATMSIPAEVRALDGYGWSAGTAYNYIDFERKVFVKRVDRVVLDGTQGLANVNWRPQTNTVGWGYPLTLTPNIKKPSSNTALANIVANSVESKTYYGLYNTDVIGIGVMQQSNTSGLFVRGNSTLTTATTINAYLSANPITVYYELDTPIETDISQYLTDNLIEVGAGGTLTFPNSNGDDYHIPVPSTETYMIDLQEAISNG